MEQVQLVEQPHIYGGIGYLQVGHHGYSNSMGKTQNEKRDYYQNKMKQSGLKQYVYVWTPQIGLKFQQIKPDDIDAGHHKLFRQIQNQHNAENFMTSSKVKPVSCMYLGRIDNQGQDSHRATVVSHGNCLDNKQNKQKLKQEITAQFGLTTFYL